MSKNAPATENASPDKKHIFAELANHRNRRDTRAPAAAHVNSDVSVS